MLPFQRPIMNFVGPEPITHEPTDREDVGVARSELNTPQAGTSTNPQIVDGVEVITHPVTCIRRRYKMAYVPSGFWSRLISRLMINLKRSGLVESEGAAKHTPSMTYWRRGILVGHSTGKFLVEAIQTGTKKGGCSDAWPADGFVCRMFIFGRCQFRPKYRGLYYMVQGRKIGELFPRLHT